MCNSRLPEKLWICLILPPKPPNLNRGHRRPTASRASAPGRANQPVLTRAQTGPAVQCSNIVFDSFWGSISRCGLRNFEWVVGGTKNKNDRHTQMHPERGKGMKKQKCVCFEDIRAKNMLETEKIWTQQQWLRILATVVCKLRHDVIVRSTTELTCHWQWFGYFLDFCRFFRLIKNKSTCLPPCFGLCSCLQ